MTLSYNLAYQEIILVHPKRRQIFAGKPYFTFWNIWDILILAVIGDGEAIAKTDILQNFVTSGAQ